MYTCGLPLYEEVRVNHLTQNYHWGFSFVLSCCHVVVEEEQFENQSSWIWQRSPIPSPSLADYHHLYET